jgi:peptidoglycan glycosyltransferase/penicillin-binding protein 2
MAAKPCDLKAGIFLALRFPRYLASSAWIFKINFRKANTIVVCVFKPNLCHTKLEVVQMIGRIYSLAIIFVFIGLLLLGRIFSIQVLDSTKLTLEALNARAQGVPITSDRGKIFDCNGSLLTDTTKQFSLLIFPTQFAPEKDKEEIVTNLLGISQSELRAKVKDNPYPFVLMAKLSESQAQEVSTLNLPGTVVIPETIRYNESALAAHVTGYINRADNRGVSGIEAMYDDILCGGRLEFAAALVDAKQQVIPGLGYKRVKATPNYSSNNIYLTIDKEIQQIAEQSLDKRGVKGAVVILRPQTGEILAMASRQNFNANDLDTYLDKSTAPLLNRAISSYQPGSVFKIVVAAAALEHNIVKPADVFFDPGYIEIDNIRFNGWDHAQGGRGYISLKEAMAYSSNPVFITVGLKLGAERLISFAKKAGFGHHTQLNFIGEADGILPQNEALYPAELANLAIGQGSFEATPLQFAVLVAAIANNGIKQDPYIVSKITDADGKIIKTFSASQGTRIFSKKTAQEMKEMLTAVTKFGTGQAAYVDRFGSAGKTGSAETGRIDEQGQSVNHAWFAGYAPLDNPEYAAVVFVEEGRSGGDVAAPIFNEIVSKVLQNGKF